MCRGAREGAGKGNTPPTGESGTSPKVIDSGQKRCNPSFLGVEAGSANVRTPGRHLAFCRTGIPKLFLVVQSISACRISNFRENISNHGRAITI